LVDRETPLVLGESELLRQGSRDEGVHRAGEG
jgi:hypothetical protein